MHYELFQPMKKLILTLFFVIFNFCLIGQNNVGIISSDTITSYSYKRLSDEQLDSTYKAIDSIFFTNKINLDQLTSYLSSMVIDGIPIGFINLKIDNIIGYNIGNGLMFGLGLETNNRLSKIFSIEGYGSYWLKAKKFNYGSDLTFKILRSKDMKLKFGAYHKFERLGNYGFKENEILLNPENFKYFYTNSTSLNDFIYVNYSTYLNKYIKAFARFEVSDKTTANSQWSTSNDQQPTVNSHRLSSLEFKLRIAFGEKFVNSKDGFKVEGDANPIIWFSYKKNLKNVFGSPYDFDKCEFLFRGKKYTRYLGETSLSAQFGYINGLAPITDVFNLYGTGENKFDIYCMESFSTMSPDEFFCDRFAALYLSHNFKNILIDFKKFHPEIIVLTNIAWMNDIRSQETTKSESQKLYYESGLIVDNILNIGIIKLGLGAFYRYGPYSYDKAWDNFVFKVCLDFGL